jgi:general stress protein YciG
MNTVSNTEIPGVQDNKKTAAQPSQMAAEAKAAFGQDELRPDLPPTHEQEAMKGRRPRGFAAIDRKLLAEIASKGGKAAHSAGTAHEFTSAEAREAGRKGGLATHAKRRKVGE